MVELAWENEVRIFQASTSEIDGDPLEHPQKKTYLGHVKTIGQRTCYDEGKYCADIRVARIFNTYGPGTRLDDGRVVSNFIVQALAGEDLTKNGQDQ